MPTYTYRCNECDHEFDARQRMTDDPLTECPVCGGTVRRVVSRVGIVFKGSGFYVTDHRNGNGGRVKTSESSGTKSDAEAKPTETKSTTEKPNKKTETKSD